MHMTARKAELRYLNRNITAIETLASSSILHSILDMMGREGKYRTITIEEFIRLNEAFLKMDNAITELNNLVHEMNGTKDEPEPHGSRDTFVPRPTRIVCNNMAFTLAKDGPDDESFNTMHD